MTQDEQRKALAPIPSDADFAASPDTVREYIAQLEYEIAALSSPVAQAELIELKTLNWMLADVPTGGEAAFLMDNFRNGLIIVEIKDVRLHPSDKGGAGGTV